ncbi:MAG: hypothetical protein ACXVDA_16275 [Ktedonobacterales bacterium]
MIRHLTTTEVLHLGRAYETRRYWRKLRDVIFSLYGEGSRYVTQTVLTTRDDSTLASGVQGSLGAQFLVTDTEHKVMPLDLTATWWQERVLTPDERSLVTTAHLDSMLGESLPEDLQYTLRRYVEDHLGDLFLTTWEEQSPLVNTYDLATLPALPFERVLVDDAGERRELREDEGIVAAKEYARYAMWEREKEYTHLLYGPQAMRMVKTTSWIYNDNSYDEMPTFDVYDAEGRRLSYDFSLPWWSRFGFGSEAIAAYRKRHPLSNESRTKRDPALINDDHDKNDVDYNMNDDDDELFNEPIINALNVLRRDLLEIQFDEIWDYVDPDTTEYDLIKPPPLHFPALILDDGSDA